MHICMHCKYSKVCVTLIHPDFSRFFISPFQSCHSKIKICTTGPSLAALYITWKYINTNPDKIHNDFLGSKLTTCLFSFRSLDSHFQSACICSNRTAGVSLLGYALAAISETCMFYSQTLWLIQLHVCPQMVKRWCWFIPVWHTLYSYTGCGCLWMLPPYCGSHIILNSYQSSPFADFLFILAVHIQV